MVENNPADAVTFNTAGEGNSYNQLTADVYENLPVAVYTCDSSGYITSFNKAAVKLWGREPIAGQEQWCGSWKIYDLKGEPTDLKDYPMARTLKEGVAINGEEIIIERPDGSKVRVKSYPVPTFNKAGLLTGAVNTLININEITNGEEKHAMLAAIVGTSDDTIVSKTLDGIITSWNKAAEVMFGYTEKEAIGKHISLLIPPSRIQEEDIIIGNIIKGNRINHFETVRVAKDGREIPISLSVSPIMDSSGKIIGASKIARDISDRYIADEKQAMLAAIVNTSDDTILSKTLGGIITSWNKAAERMFGYTQEEAVGKHISLLIPPSRLKEEEYIIGQVAQGKPVEHFETVRLTKAGKEITISLSVSPVKDSSGKIIGASKIARDITGQKEAVETYKRYTERLEIINHIVKLVSEELDLNKILQKVTDATTQLTGAQFGAFFYNKVDISGESFMLYTLSGAPKEAFEKFGMPRNTAVFHTTFSGQGVVRVDDITKDERYGLSSPHFGMPKGHLPVVSYLAVPVISRSGEVIGGLFFGHPEPAMFTKEHEELVVPIAAQAAIGLDNAKLYEEVKALNEKKDEFIGLASHELKTPLTSITGYLQILDRLKSDDSSGKFVTKTIQQVKKLTALVSDLLDVSKIEAGKLQLLQETFDIRATLEDAIELIQHSHNTHEITLHSSIDFLEVHGDTHRIEQVIINLLTNAIKYSYLANKVEVFLTQTDDEVKIGVKDYGIGIAPEKRAQVFSRFYRVEELNPHISGLGIGLYISHEIISRHNGKLWVDSELDKGSTFWFTLPL
jgi:PAS domain S-box-containing protein